MSILWRGPVTVKTGSSQGQCLKCGAADLGRYRDQEKTDGLAAPGFDAKPIPYCGMNSNDPQRKLGVSGGRSV
jgi:hypothetical protein